MNKKSTALVTGGAIIVAVFAGIKASSKRNLAPKDQEIVSPVVPKETEPTPVSEPKKLVLKELTIDWKRTVIIKDVILDSNIDQVVEYVTALEDSADPIYILIDSPGGSILAGERLISAMESAKGPVYTVCTGLCASMGAVIHAYGTKRYAQNRAILMYHDAAGSFEGNFARMKSQFALVQRKVDKVDEYICYRAHIDCKEFRAKKLNETWLDAEDAYNLGFVDAVVKTVGNPLVRPLAINANVEGSNEDDSDVKKLDESIKSVK